MFNSKKENLEMNTHRESNSTGINSLGNGTSITGDLTAQGDIRIDGELLGNVRCSGKVILGPKGKIKGEVTCENAVIEGKIDGLLKVKDHLQVMQSAAIKGEITTNKLTVQSGAVFNVKCDMGGQTIAPKTIPHVKTA